MPDVRQTSAVAEVKILGMDAGTIPAIVATERLTHGLIVRFADGTCVFYPADLLYRLVPLAEVQDETAKAW